MPFHVFIQCCYTSGFKMTSYITGICASTAWIKSHYLSSQVHKEALHHTYLQFNSLPSSKNVSLPTKSNNFFFFILPPVSSARFSSGSSASILPWSFTAGSASRLRSTSIPCFLEYVLVNTCFIYSPLHYLVSTERTHIQLLNRHIYLCCYRS